MRASRQLRERLTARRGTPSPPLWFTDPQWWRDASARMMGGLAAAGVLAALAASAGIVPWPLVGGWVLFAVVFCAEWIGFIVLWERLRVRDPQPIGLAFLLLAVFLGVLGGTCFVASLALGG